MQNTNEKYLDEFVGMSRASTIIIVRNNNNRLETLLVKRHENVEFAGGAYVFPGGRHDISDTILFPYDAGITDYAKIAAIRETFEETGYLFARDKNNLIVGDRLNNCQERHNIINHPTQFVEFMKTNGFTPAIDLLVPVSIWVPPEYAKKRYLTWFFIAEMPQSTIIIPDNKEIIDFTWQEANKALEQIEHGEINALFPTMANLSFVSEFQSFEQIKNHLDCKNMPLIRTKTIDKGINLWVETDIKDFYPYSTKQFH